MLVSSCGSLGHRPKNADPCSTALDACKLFGATARHWCAGAVRSRLVGEYTAPSALGLPSLHTC